LAVIVTNPYLPPRLTSGFEGYSRDTQQHGKTRLVYRIGAGGLAASIFYVGILQAYPMTVATVIYSGFLICISAQFAFAAFFGRWWTESTTADSGKPQSRQQRARINEHID